MIVTAAGAAPQEGTALARHPHDAGGTLDMAAMHTLIESYRRHERRIFRLCMQHLHHPEAAQDATQETFVRAAAHLHSLSGDVLVAYLSVIARRVCYDEARRQRRHGLAVDELRASEVPDDPERAAVDHATIGDIWDQLSRREQSLVLCRFAGLSYDEIATRLDTSAMAARAAVSRVRRRARTLLDGLWALLVLPLVCRRTRRRMARTFRSGGVGALAVEGAASRGPLWAILLLTTGAVSAGLAVHGWDQRTAGAPRTAVVADAAPLALDGVQVISVATAPADGRTVYASGYARRGCAQVCPVLYRSLDEGTSWQRLSATGLAGGMVVLQRPASGPAVMFAATPAGLQRSDDGGRSFRTVTAVTGPIAAAATGTAGGIDVVVGGQPLWLYHADTGVLAPGPALPPAVIGIDAVTFAGDARHIVATGRQVNAVTPTKLDAVIIRCELPQRCQRSLSVAGDPFVAVSASERGVAALSPRALYLSADGARTFHRAGAVDARGGGGLAWDHAVPLVAAVDGSGRLHLAPQPAPVAGAVGPVRWLIRLPDGRLLAAPATPDAGGRWGLRCFAPAATGSWESCEP